MKGFATIDESMGLLPFMRGGQGFYIKEHHRASALSYDWTDSVYDQTSIAAYTQIHSSTDNWTGGGARSPNHLIPHLGMTPYVDTSSGTPTLKICHSGHSGHGADDFGEVDTGVQGVDDNNWLSCYSTTGVTFSGGNMVDGDHTVKWKHRHDAKPDTYYTVTAVMWASSNVLEARAHWANNTAASTGDYVTTAFAKTNGILYWKVTWDPDDNTWTIQEDDTDLAGAHGHNVGFETSGGTLQKETAAYYIDGSDPEDHRYWGITVGAT